MNRFRGKGGGVGGGGGGRDGWSSWIGARPTAGATALMVAIVATFLVYAFLRTPEWVPQHLALVPRRALGREPWQFLTSPFVHLRGMAMISSLIGVWIFATAVEQRSSRGRMFLYFGITQVAAELVAAAIGRAVAPDVVLDGCSAGVLGLVAAFGVLYGPIPLRFFGLVEMKGRTMALLIVGLSILTEALNRDLFNIVESIVAVAVGWAIAGNVGTGIASAYDRLRLWRLRRRYRVIPGGRDTKRYLN